MKNGVSYCARLFVLSATLLSFQFAFASELQPRTEFAQTRNEVLEGMKERQNFILSQNGFASIGEAMSYFLSQTPKVSFRQLSKEQRTAYDRAYLKTNSVFDDCLLDLTLLIVKAGDEEVRRAFISEYQRLVQIQNSLSQSFLNTVQD